MGKDSIVDLILIGFTEFTIKSYIYSEFFSAMEKQVCECNSFGGVIIIYICIIVYFIQQIGNYAICR